jgi:hypothetical protein
MLPSPHEIAPSPDPTTAKSQIRDWRLYLDIMERDSEPPFLLPPDIPMGYFDGT